MTALPSSTLSADLERYLTYIHEDLRGHPLASIRGSALAARLRQLVSGALQRVRLGRMQIGLLVPIRALLRDISSYTTILRNSNIVRLFVTRERVSHELRAFQLRLSNLAARLQIYVKPFLSVDDIRTTSQDNTFFSQTLASYRSNHNALQSLVRTIRPEELRELHGMLSSSLYMQPNRLVGAAAVEFALKTRQAIEQAAGHRGGLSFSTSLASPRMMPPIGDIRRDIGSLPTLPAVLSPAASTSPLAQPLSTPATQPAFGSLRSPRLEALLNTSMPQALGARSAPMAPYGTPPGSVVGSQISSLDLGGALSPDPILFEDTRVTTVFEEASPFPSSASFSIDPFGAATSASPATARPHIQNTFSPNQPASPASIPLPPSPLLSPNAVPRLTTIRYYDANQGKFLEWRAFHGWLWQIPHLVEAAKDYHGGTVQAQSIVTVVAQFVGLDEVQRQAILDHISLPSRAPALLRQAVLGDKLRVLRLFSIRGTTWLACVPFEGGKPGFIPLKATILDGNPPPILPRLLPAPIHGSVRSFHATYKFLDSRGYWRIVNCAGVIQPYRISYHEVRMTGIGLTGTLQLPLTWLHFPYSQVLGLTRMPSHTEVKLLLLDRTASREVHIHFASALEALQFYEDVEHMRRVTRQLLELQERRRREAELRNAVASPSQQGGETGSLGTATMQQSANAATSASPGAVPSSVGHQASADSGLSPYLGAFYDSNQSPHLSQLGSPRLNSLL